MSDKTNEILEAIKQLCKEKGLSEEIVLGTIEQALAAAYRKDFGQKDQNIKVKFDPQTGEIKAFDVKTVVDYGPEEIEEEKDQKPSSSAKATEGEEKKKFNPKFHLTLEEAKKIKRGAKIDDEIITELEVPAPFGRMAAQTAKQVIIQRLKEAERGVLFSEFKEKEGKIINGIVQRRIGKNFLVDLGKTIAVLPFEEQIRMEQYNSGQRIKVFIISVNQTLKGPEIIISRSHPEIIRELFTLEIPEIANKTVEIKSIAREAGVRSKVAVTSKQENLDPIGACIGQRGSRIQTIIAELGGEKVDIIEYNEDPKEFIAHALSPAKVLKVELGKKNKIAKVKVKEDQLSLAIGRGGQNVRLASRLTGWAIEIKGDQEVKEGIEKKEVVEQEEKPTVSKEKTESKESSEAGAPPPPKPKEKKTKKKQKEDLSSEALAKEEVKKEE